MEDTLRIIKKNNQAWATRDRKAHLEKLVSEALIVDVDDEGNWIITDSSVKNAVDDILTYYELTDRNEEEGIYDHE